MINLLAQEIYNPIIGPVGEGGGVTWFSNLVPAIVSLLLTIGAVVFVIMFLYGGIKWITAGGDKGKLESAKNTLTNAIVGVTFLLLTILVLTFVECFFGIGLHSFDIGPFSVTPAGSPACSGIIGGGGSSGGGTTASTGGGSTGGGTGGGTAGTTSANCSGCIDGGCGYIGEVYLGPSPADDNYLCTAGGWEFTTDPVTSTTCGTCP